jgi:DNA polymerase-1
MEKVTKVSINFEPPAFRVFTDPQEGEAVIRELLNSRYEEIYVDIETGIEKDVSFEQADRHKLLAVGLGYKAGSVVVLGEEALEDRRVQHALGRLLGTKKLGAHNGKFDLKVLQRLGSCGLSFDTMLAAYALDERPGTNGLKYLAVEELGAPNYDAELKRYVGPKDSYEVVPRDILYKYNAYDVACGWLLKEKFERELQDEGLRELHDFLIEASNELMHVELAGVAIDLPYLEQLTHDYVEVLEAVEDDLHEWVDNPRSPKQVKEALALFEWIVETTNADQLETIRDWSTPASSLNRFMNLMLRYRKEQKLYGTYVKGIRKRLYRGRVHPTFLLHGTTTGRLACRNPNLQNVPRESVIRRAFVPSRGNVFVQADYSTIELRVMATLAGDETLRKIFVEDRDIHDEFSKVFYGENFTKDQRVRTKAFVYGSTYGREAYSIAQEYGMIVAEARRMQKQLFDAMPAVQEWRNEIQRTILHDQEDLITPFGRHRRFWLITEENKKDVVKEGLAFKPQSTASDVNLTAFTRLRRDHGLDLRIPVHDSILAECPADAAQDVADLMVKVMSEVATEKLGDFVPFPVEVKFGANWGEV